MVQGTSITYVKWLVEVAGGGKLKKISYNICIYFQKIRFVYKMLIRYFHFYFIQHIACNVGPKVEQL